MGGLLPAHLPPTDSAVALEVQQGLPCFLAAGPRLIPAARDLSRIEKGISTSQIQFEPTEQSIDGYAGLEDAHSSLMMAVHRPAWCPFYKRGVSTQSRSGYELQGQEAHRTLPSRRFLLAALCRATSSAAFTSSCSSAYHSWRPHPSRTAHPGSSRCWQFLKAHLQRLLQSESAVLHPCAFLYGIIRCAQVPRRPDSRADQVW